MALTLEDLQAVVADKFGGVLTAGAHSSNGKEGACLFEAYSFARGKEWGAECPSCMAPDLHSLLIRLNDSTRWASDTERTEVLLPALIRALGTAGDDQARRARSMRLADVAMRKIAPAALDAAKLPELAQRLRDVAPIVDPDTARAAAAEGREVRRAAAAYAAAAAAAAYAAAYAAYAAAYAAYAADAAAAAYADAAARSRAWRAHVDALLVAAGLKD